MKQMTANPVACAVVATLALGAHAAYADGATNELVEAEASIELPSVEAGAFYCSKKIERGMVENKESVFGYEVEVERYGFFGGVESCHDMTNVERRRGRYNEIESFAGYGFLLGDFSAKAAYVYKACGGGEHDTQEIEFELECETPWVTPSLECELDVDDTAGATYGAFGLRREWKIADWLSLCPNGGVGFGNAYRNRTDFGSDKMAMRDIHAGLEVEIELCPRVKLIPGVDLYDQFTSAARHEYHKGFVAVGGVKLVAEF